jgi:hypothetical protein
MRRGNAGKHRLDLGRAQLILSFLRRIAFPCDQICKVRSLVNTRDMFDDNMKLEFGHRQTHVVPATFVFPAIFSRAEQLRGVTLSGPLQLPQSYPENVRLVANLGDR